MNILSIFRHEQGVRSQTATPEGSPSHRPDRDSQQTHTISSASASVDKNPAPVVSSGGFMSWVPGIRGSSAQSNPDTTSAVVGPSKSPAEELVSGMSDENWGEERESISILLEYGRGYSAGFTFIEGATEALYAVLPKQCTIFQGQRGGEGRPSVSLSGLSPPLPASSQFTLHYFASHVLNEMPAYFQNNLQRLSQTDPQSGRENCTRWPYIFVFPFFQALPSAFRQRGLTDREQMDSDIIREFRGWLFEGRLTLIQG